MNIGDTVHTTGVESPYNDRLGKIQALHPDGYLVRLAGDTLSKFFTEVELDRITPQFVNVVTSRSIWVTLPGDNAGHKLTNDDALALLRQLEEALS